MTIYFSLPECGFYDDAFNTTIPKSAVKITKEERQKMIQWMNNKGRIDIEDGAIKFLDPHPPKVKDLKWSLIQYLDNQTEHALQGLVQRYPKSEQMSWSKQESEARAFQIDSLAQTPLLDAIVSERGKSKKDLAQRIIEKAESFSLASGKIIGKRQYFEKHIDQCETLEQLEVIKTEMQAWYATE